MPVSTRPRQGGSLTPTQFYNSKRWRDYRKVLILESKGMCSKCNQLFVDTSKLIINHIEAITEDNVNDISVSLSRKNLEVLCIDCHNKHHHRFNAKPKGVTIYATKNYNWVKRTVCSNVPVSTLIVDEHRIYEAIGDSQHNLKANMVNIRNKMYEDIKHRLGSWEEAIVILIDAEPYEVNELAKRLNATVVHVEDTEATPPNTSTSAVATV